MRQGVLKKDLKFTIFTPLYNGSKTIHRTYQSLKSLTYRNFEWILINDGSNDNSHEIVIELIKDFDCEVVYINWTENQGKHIAWNYAAKLAKGEVFITLDCDDTLVPCALDFLNDIWIKYYDDESIYGVDTLCQDPISGSLCGTSFPYDNIKSNYGELLNKYNVRGDKLNSFRTKYMREFPFPHIRASYYTECFLLYSLGEHYSSIGINKVLRHYYQEANSITHTRREQLKNIYMLFHYQKWHIPRVASTLLWENPRELFRCIKELILMFIKYRLMKMLNICEIVYADRRE